MMKKFLPLVLTAFALCLPLAACGDTTPSDDPGENVGNAGNTTGGNTGNTGGNTGGNPGGNTGNTGGSTGGAVVPTSNNAEAAKATDAITFPTDQTERVYDGSNITQSGVYAVRGTLTKKITVICDEPVELKFYDVTLSVTKKAIDAGDGAGDLILTLSGKNSIRNTNTAGSNGIDVLGDLLIRGDAGASLTMETTKNAIKANSVTVEGASLDITAQKDGLHAEIDRYDLASFVGVPDLSYADGGFVHLKDADVTLEVADDGIQADTFVWVEGETNLQVKTNGGAPASITAQTSAAANGKGIKTGALDYGVDGTQLAWEKYLILIEGGVVQIDSNDDALHSEGEIVLAGGELTIASGDDAMHAKNLFSLADGTITVSRCYEGVEATKVEILGGELNVTAVDDGINASDGIENIPGSKNANCRILISGGKTTVVSSGDGVDSNGDFIMTGGTLFVTGPSSGDNTALDADGETRIDGGYLLAVGCSGMMGSSPSNVSKQNVIVYTHASNLSVSEVYLADMGGTKLISYTPARAFSNIVVSCPELAAGSTYSLHAGTQTLADNIAIISSVTTLGTQQGGGGFGPGGQGGWGGPGGQGPGGGRR